MSVEFKLPELGENVEKGDVVRVLVNVGDVVKKDQGLVELETDKATIEVPSSIAGKITEIRVKAGDKVKVGQVIVLIDETAGASTAPPAEKPASAATAPPVEKPAVPASRPETGEPAKVVDITTARPPAAAKSEPSSPTPARVAAAPAAAQAEGAAGSPPSADLAPPVPAAPSVRRLARELGVEISAVAGTGPAGRIGEDDVKAYVKAMASGSAARGTDPFAPAALPDFTKWGAVETKPMSGIRRKTARHLTQAWNTIPHVTQHDKADITALEAFRATYGPRVEQAGGKLTVTAILVKVAAMALNRFPRFATSVDLARETIIYKQYRHIGVAVDTPNGLLVPVVRDADRKTLTEIAVEIGALSQKARDKKLSLDEMAGGCFTISNLGGIGGTSFSPIVNLPEVAILGVSRGAMEPVWHPSTALGAGGEFVPRQMLPLSLSYDHRVIDGADAIRFVRFIVDAIEQPMTMYL